ncbi:hypothetical protein AAEO50_16810 [Rossellomorea oryzaecorticis]|uniref:Uncharacterized protein n=1 Tax=Rossellomorea oryzaecorticis TaxID=1396505 RepID=A0ABU9KCU8_9BACI
MRKPTLFRGVGFFDGAGKAWLAASRFGRVSKQESEACGNCRNMKNDRYIGILADIMKKWTIKKFFGR